MLLRSDQAFWMRNFAIKQLLPQVTDRKAKSDLEFRWVQLLTQNGWTRHEIVDETGLNYHRVRRLQNRLTKKMEAK